MSGCASGTGARRCTGDERRRGTTSNAVPCRATEDLERARRARAYPSRVVKRDLRARPSREVLPLSHSRGSTGTGRASMKESTWHVLSLGHYEGARERERKKHMDRLAPEPRPAPPAHNPSPPPPSRSIAPARPPQASYRAADSVLPLDRRLRLELPEDVRRDGGPRDGRDGVLEVLDGLRVGGKELRGSARVREGQRVRRGGRMGRRSAPRRGPR